MKYTTYDRENAPTEILAQREHHRIATLGRNKIIRDHYKTQALSGRERVTRLLPRKKRPRQLLSTVIRKIFGTICIGILATRKGKSK